MTCVVRGLSNFSYKASSISHSVSLSEANSPKTLEAAWHQPESLFHHHHLGHTKFDYIYLSLSFYRRANEIYIYIYIPKSYNLQFGLVFGKNSPMQISNMVLIVHGNLEHAESAWKKFGPFGVEFVSALDLIKCL